MSVYPADNAGGARYANLARERTMLRETNFLPSAAFDGPILQGFAEQSQVGNPARSCGMLNEQDGLESYDFPLRIVLNQAGDCDCSGGRGQTEACGCEAVDHEMRASFHAGEATQLHATTGPSREIGRQNQSHYRRRRARNGSNSKVAWNGPLDLFEESRTSPMCDCVEAGENGYRSGKGGCEKYTAELAQPIVHDATVSCWPDGSACSCVASCESGFSGADGVSYGVDPATYNCPGPLWEERPGVYLAELDELWSIPFVAPNSAPTRDDAKIEVAARHFTGDGAMWLAGLLADHLFFIITSTDKSKYAIQGGPTKDEQCPDSDYGLGCLFARSSRTDGITRNKPDFAPVIVASGTLAEHAKDCVDGVAEAVDQAHNIYNPALANSNSLVGTVLRACGLPATFPLGARPVGFIHDVPF